MTKAATTVLRHLRRAALLGAAPEVTDGQLLEAFVNRDDQAAFGLLVRRHGPLVFGVCQRVIGHTQDAEDAFQATFLVLARKAPTVMPREAVGSWLYGVACRTARRARAIAARRWAREKQVKSMPETTTRPPQSVADWEPVLDDELDKLADKYRLPLVLCDLEGQPCKQVAFRLKIPIGTLFSRLSRARRILAQRLRQRGVTLAGGALATMFDSKSVLANVPHPLVSSTIKAATTVAGGSAATLPVSNNVAALTQGVLKAMFLNKLKTFSAMLLVVVCIGGGAGTLVSRSVLADASTPGPRKASNEDREQAERFSFGLGDIVRARFFFRNAGDNPVNISYPRLITQDYYKALQFTENRSQQIPIHQEPAHGLPVGWIGIRLAPGEHAETEGLFLSVGNAPAEESVETVLKAKPGHTYSICYTLPNYGDRKAADQQTGRFTFSVIEKGAAEPKHPTGEELKKRIAWGSPSKNGLQVGVLLSPVKDEDPTNKSAPAKDTDEGDMQALQGGWEGQSGERDGKALPDDEIKKLRVSIKGDRMLMIPGAEWTPLRIKLDPAKNPKVLHATPIEGPEKEKTLPVIYRLDKEADTLTLCFDEKNGKAVPEDFAARRGSGLMLLVLKHELRPPTAPAARE